MDKFEVITLENNVPTLSTDIEEVLIILDKEEKRIKEQKEVYRKALLDAMEKHNIKSIKTDNVSITYKDETMRESFDSKKFREENEELYNEYCKFSPVKSSLLIKINE